MSWSVYLDFADGRLARDRFQGPPHRRAYGRELDSFADLVAFSVASGLLIFCANDGALVPALIGLLFAIFGCLRLAYFNVYDLDKGYFRGIPTTYAGLLVAVIYAVGFLTLHVPLWLVNVLCVAIGCAQVAPVRVPKLPLSLSAVFALAFALTVLVMVQVGAQ